MSWLAETQSRMKSKLPRVLLHCVGVFGDHHFIRAQPQAIRPPSPATW